MRKEFSRLRAAVEADLLCLAEGETPAESRWNRPRKQPSSLRADCELVDWFKSKGPGYQTRINRILRKAMVERKKRESWRLCHLRQDSFSKLDTPTLSHGPRQGWGTLR